MSLVISRGFGIEGGMVRVIRIKSFQISLRPKLKLNAKIRKKVRLTSTLKPKITPTPDFRWDSGPHWDPGG